jgi:hypothetical protein
MSLLILLELVIHKKYTVDEIKQLKKQTKLLLMYSQGASIAEIQRSLLSELSGLLFS